MDYLLTTLLFATGCHADGPLPWWLRDTDVEIRSLCPARELIGLDSERFRTLDQCEDDARLRWVNTGYRAASSCRKVR